MFVAITELMEQYVGHEDKPAARTKGISIHIRSAVLSPILQKRTATAN